MKKLYLIFLQSVTLSLFAQQYLYQDFKEGSVYLRENENSLEILTEIKTDLTSELVKNYFLQQEEAQFLFTDTKLFSNQYTEGNEEYVQFPIAFPYPDQAFFGVWAILFNNNTFNLTFDFKNPLNYEAENLYSPKDFYYAVSFKYSEARLSSRTVVDITGINLDAIREELVKNNVGALRNLYYSIKNPKKEDKNAP